MKQTEASPLEAAEPARRWAALMPWLGVLASSVLLALYARGGAFWMLGFVVWVPWLLGLSQVKRQRDAWLLGAAMSVGYVLAALHWFAPAFAAYVGVAKLPALLLLIVLAPALQPQLLAFALLHYLGRQRGAWLIWSLLPALAWVATEWLWPKLLGDTFSHGLQSSAWLRQAADLAGASGLTWLLLMVNACVAVIVQAWRHRRAQALQALVLGLAIVLLWSAYGYWRLAEVRAVQAVPSLSVRVGMVQANITKLEQMRAERGAYAVIRHLLDTHYAMSAHAVQQQGAEALLWSETIYPTTFGSPKSEDGAALDQEILQFVRDLNVPLVMGTYDLDDAGEYNSAAFLEPERGLLGHYRKTHPFPLTEYVPDWLDGPAFRRLLPWTGAWKAGQGARALPLRTADGREVNVVPLICLDDVYPQLAIDGARLGAQALVGLSNDSWFTDYPEGARLHLAVASFRSIETRLPQLRVTTNGYSAMVDESGEIVARTEMNQQAVFVGEIPIRDPAPTLMVHWGDWFGRCALIVLVLLAVLPVLRRLQAFLDARAERRPAVNPSDWTASVLLLSKPLRLVLIALHAIALLGLIWLALRMLWIDGLQVNSLTQIYGFAAFVAGPILLSWLIQAGKRYQARIQDGQLQFVRPGTRIEIDLDRIQSIEVLRLATPLPALVLSFDSGQRFESLIAVADPAALSAAVTGSASGRWANAVSARRAEEASTRARTAHAWLDATWFQYGLWPLLMALPAFRLHQHITFGGTFGEWQTFGAGAWLVGLLIWWVAWAIGLALFGSFLRITAVVLRQLLQRWRRPDDWHGVRTIAWIRRAVYYLGVPLWLAVRILGG